MKKTTITMSLAILLANSALATGHTPFLVFESTNGPREPRYQNKTTCFIEEKTVSIKRHTGALPDAFNETNISFTSEVKNVDALIEIIHEARKGKVKKSKHGAINGSETSTYSMIELDRAAKVKLVPLLTTQGSYFVSKNTSEAAKKLIKFIDYNCNEQN